MSDTADKYCKRIIQRPECQEMCYRTVLSYCKILQGREVPWCYMSGSIERADIHNRIAEYCDCDHDVVTEAVDKVFPDAESLGDDVFLKNVDRLMDELKAIADMPEEKRFPSFQRDGRRMW